MRSTKLISVLIAFAILTLTGCTTVPPKSVATNFLNAIQKDDVVTAAQYVQPEDGQNISEELKSDDPQSDEARKLLFTKVKYEILSATTNGDSAEVKANITSVDLVSVTSSVMGKLMPLAFASAFSSNPDDNNIDELADQYLKDAIADQNAPMVTNEVTLHMKKVDSKWLIVPDEELLNALTGNAGKLSKLFGE